MALLMPRLTLIFAFSALGCSRPPLGLQVSAGAHWPDVVVDISGAPANQTRLRGVGSFALDTASCGPGDRRIQASTRWFIVNDELGDAVSLPLHLAIGDSVAGYRTAVPLRRLGAACYVVTLTRGPESYWRAFRILPDTAKQSWVISGATNKVD